VLVLQESLVLLAAVAALLPVEGVLLVAAVDLGDWMEG
jgi:hypothetical protein